MSEERPVHTQEPAEGAEEDVESPGAEKAGDPSNPGAIDAERQPPTHPQDPAEGGDEEVEAPGADRSGSGD